MREIVTVPTAQIDCDTLPMNRKVMQFALDMLVMVYRFPPVKLTSIGNGRYRLTDGRHRLAAHKLLERNRISAMVSKRRIQ